MSRWASNLDILTFVGLTFILMVFAVGVAFFSSGCSYETTEEGATGWSPDAGPDVHRGEYLTPPAARLEHSKGKQP